MAALGFGVTLADPVGLFVDHLDMAGFTVADRMEPLDPDGFEVGRGRSGMFSRAVFAAPKGSTYSVSDVKIAGEPIRYGGQLAERMTVKLIGLAATGADHHNAPIALGNLGTDVRAFVLSGNPNMVDGISVDTKADAPHDVIRVFDHPTP